MGKLILLCGLFALASAKTLPLTSTDVTSQLPSTQATTVIGNEEPSTPKEEQQSPVVPRQRFIPDPAILMRPGNKFYYHVPISPETEMAELRPQFQQRQFDSFVPYYPPPSMDAKPMEEAPSSNDQVTASPESSQETTTPPSTMTPSSDEQDSPKDSSQAETEERSMEPEVPEEPMPEENPPNFSMDEMPESQPMDRDSGPMMPSYEESESRPMPPSNEEPESQSSDDGYTEMPPPQDEQPEMEPQQTPEEQRPPSNPETPTENFEPQDQGFVNPYYEYNPYFNDPYQYPYQPKWFDSRPPAVNYGDDTMPMNNVVETEYDVMRGNFERGFN